MGLDPSASAPRSAALGALLGLLLFAACSVDEIELSGKQCPCASGWVCDTSRNTCVPRGTSLGGAAGSATGGTAGADAAAGASGASGSGGVAGSAGATDAGDADANDGAAGGCDAAMKLCDGGCVAATTANGCGGPSCDPCPDYPSSSPVCTGGACGIACSAGYGNCDGVVTNGCEKQIDVSDPDNCGKCARTCGTNHASATTCVAASCSPTCETGYGNCNESSKLVPDDGCETNLNGSTSNCGRCGYSCSAQGGVSAKFTCFSGACGCSTPAQCLSDSTLTGVSCDTASHRCVCGSTTCGVGEICVKQGSSSTCACNGVAKCTGSTTCCAATGCKNLASDSANCGVCGLACATGKTCQAGKCV